MQLVSLAAFFWSAVAESASDGATALALKVLCALPSGRHHVKASQAKAVALPPQSIKVAQFANHKASGRLDLGVTVW